MPQFRIDSACRRSWCAALARTIGLTVLIGCGGDKSLPLSTEQPIASIVIWADGLPLQPLETKYATVGLLDADGHAIERRVPVAWTSSDTSIVAVQASTSLVGFEARAPGMATITARVGAAIATTTVSVAWNADTRLAVSAPSELGVGDRTRIVAAVGPIVLGERVSWVSSNDRVARVEPAGWLVAIAPGTTTLSASFAGLSSSAVVSVPARSRGFGYMYAQPDPDMIPEYAYDSFDWAPDPALGFSTAGIASSIVAPPYGVRPDFGWVGPSREGSGAAIYAVSLAGARCGAATEPPAGWGNLMPIGGCDWQLPNPAGYSQWGVGVSASMEILAFRPGEFDGTLAVVRTRSEPMSTAGGVVESVASGARAFEISDAPNDSVFWFVTPDAAVLAPMCSISREAASSAVAVRCASVGTPDLRRFTAIGFGTNVRRAGAPIGFVELDGRGTITRKMVSGLDIVGVDGTDVHEMTIAVSGAALASFPRLPAVLVTPIADVAASCSLVGAPSRAGSERVLVRVRCDAAVHGITFGVIY